MRHGPTRSKRTSGRCVSSSSPTATTPTTQRSLERSAATCAGATLIPETPNSSTPSDDTLAATVQWSYRLLPEAERVLFDRLSVFAGGFTLPAAEAVCADDPLERL